MPNPRLSAAERKRRGTYRADRDYDAVDEPQDVVLAEYKRLAVEAYSAASRNEPAPVVPGSAVRVTPAFLAQIERRLADGGMVMQDGRPWNLSEIVKIAQ
jgi:hypothetical protein